MCRWTGGMEWRGQQTKAPGHLGLLWAGRSMAPAHLVEKIVQVEVELVPVGVRLDVVNESTSLTSTEQRVVECSLARTRGRTSAAQGHIKTAR